MLASSKSCLHTTCLKESFPHFSGKKKNKIITVPQTSPPLNSPEYPRREGGAGSTWLSRAEAGCLEIGCLSGLCDILNKSCGKEKKKKERKKIKRNPCLQILGSSFFLQSSSSADMMAGRTLEVSRNVHAHI